MAKKLKQSPLFKLGKRDFIRGFFMAVGTAVLTAIYKMFDEAIAGESLGMKDFDTIWKVAVGSGLVYLLKNFVTAPDDKTVSLECENDRAGALK